MIRSFRLEPPCLIYHAGMQGLHQGEALAWMGTFFLQADSNHQSAKKCFSRALAADASCAAAGVQMTWLLILRLLVLSCCSCPYYEGHPPRMHGCSLCCSVAPYPLLVMSQGLSMRLTPHLS